ncbi:MAG: O-antigen polysaccharide polymerase Wzy [Oscillospiraceae bacterium]
MVKNVYKSFINSLNIIQLMFFTVMYFVLLRDKDISHLNLKFATLLVVLCYFIGIFLYYRKARTLFSMYIIGFLMLLFYNMGQVILWTFIPNYDFYFRSMFDTFNINEIYPMVIFQMICISYLSFFSNLALNKRYIKNQEKVYNQIKENKKCIDKKIMISFLIIYAIYFTNWCYMLYLRLDMTYMNFFYSGKYYVNPYIEFLFIILLGYVLIATNNKKVILLSFVLGSSVIGVMMFIGTRNRAIPIFIMFFMALLLRGFKYTYNNKKVLIVIILCIVVVLPMMSIPKYLRGYSIEDMGGAIEKFDYRIFFNPIEEMGQSAESTIYTIRAKDEGVIGHVPTIPHSIAKSFIPNFILRAFGDTMQTFNVAKWVTAYSGRNADKTGIGYTLIAEFYINMGHLGFLLAGLYGYLFITLENFLYLQLSKRRILNGVMIIYVLSKLIFLARGAFILMIGPMRYVLMLFAVYAFLSFIIKREKYEKMMQHWLTLTY